MSEATAKQSKAEQPTQGNTKQHKATQKKRAIQSNSGQYKAIKSSKAEIRNPKRGGEQQSRDKEPKEGEKEKEQQSKYLPPRTLLRSKSLPRACLKTVRDGQKISQRRALLRCLYLPQVSQERSEDKKKDATFNKRVYANARDIFGSSNSLIIRIWCSVFKKRRANISTKKNNLIVNYSLRRGRINGVRDHEYIRPGFGQWLIGGRSSNKYNKDSVNGM